MRRYSVHVMTNEANIPTRSQVNVRGQTKLLIDCLADQHRLSITETVAVAVEAFEAMSPAEQRAVIERRGQQPKEANAA